MIQEFDTKEYDEIVINLNVISKIEQNKKLVTTGTYLNIEKDAYFPEAIRRWFRGDCRDDSIKKIDLVVNKGIFLLNNNEDIKDYLIKSKKGINNLIETYSKCEQTKARLETIIDNIDRAIGETNVDKSSITKTKDLYIDG